jgi:hypothetical protein
MHHLLSNSEEDISYLYENHGNEIKIFSENKEKNEHFITTEWGYSGI